VTRWFENDVIAPLEAFATLPSWLTAAMDASRVRASLQHAVPELADGRLALFGCSPERLRAKEDGWLARYRVTVAAPGHDPADVVLVGNLYGPAMEVPRAEARWSATSFGADGWACWLADLGLELRVEQADPALPALQDIVDPVVAADLLQKVLVDAGYGSALVTSCRPRVVRYKPGSRCTVVVDVSYAAADGDQAGPNPIVIKTHHGDKGEVAWAAMTALWESPLRRQGVVSIAEPLAYDPERRLLFQGPIPEDRTLKVLARDAIADGSPAALGRLREELAKTGRALAALHRSGASYGRTATVEGELLEIREVVDRLACSLPQVVRAARPLLDRLEQLAETLPADPCVPAHRAFRPAQVLLHAGGLGFIDFDGASMAEPALDLARFRVQLREVGISGLADPAQPLIGPLLSERLSLVDDLCEHFLRAYREQAPVSSERVLLWETCDLLTVMLHTWTKVRLPRVGPRLTLLQHHLSAAGQHEAGGGDLDGAASPVLEP